MSSDGIGVVRFKNGERAPFARAIAERIFNRGAIDSDVSSEIIRWIDGEAEIDLGEGDEIDGFWCARFTSLTFIERLYEVACEVGLVVIWPGSDPWWIVTDADVIVDLPLDFKVEHPAIANSLKEFIEILGIVFINPRPFDRIA